MIMGLMQQRRAPYSDWRAQVERLVERHLGQPFELPHSQALIGCYMVGLTPIEVARDWHDWSKSNAKRRHP